VEGSEIGEVEFNKHLEEIGATWTLKNGEQFQIALQFKDSATHPAVALEQMKRFHKQDIDIILGLESSENISKIKQYAQRNNMLLLSCCSSASSPELTIPNDNLFRLVPDDSNQGEVLAKLLVKDGIKKIIPVWRDDIWGNSLLVEVNNYFNSTEGKVTDGIRYPPNSPEIVSMSKLNEMVIEHVNGTNVDEVAVLFLSFKEIAQFMELGERSDTTQLEQVRWYGPGAITKENEIINNIQSLHFSQNIDLTTVQVAASNNANYTKVQKHLIDKLGKTPNAFVYPSYDAVWIIGLAMLETQSSDTSKIQAKIPEIAEDYIGAIGPTTLNAAGDLAHAKYEVWKLQEGDWGEPIGHYYKDKTDSEWKYTNNPINET